MMRKERLLLVLLALLAITPMRASMAKEMNYPTKNHVASWKDTWWIKAQNASDTDYGVQLFRRSFDLTTLPEQLIVHLSADNRYKFFVNGEMVAIGPQGGDILHWFYETIDIAPYLKEGKNVLAAEVVNWGPERYFGIISLRTAFVLSTDHSQFKDLSTSYDPEWRAMPLQCYKPVEMLWAIADESKKDIIGGFYASNPGDRLDVSAYPVGWTEASFDDSQWQKAEHSKAASTGGHVWRLTPRHTPQVRQQASLFNKVVRCNGIDAKAATAFSLGKAPLTIVPNTKATLMLDFSTVTMGFPRLKVAQGKGATIKINYAEMLFNPDFSKGNRHETEGKHIRGMYDVIALDGRAFTFVPLWYRTFRYVQLTIETADQPVVIEDYRHYITQSPMPINRSFDCDDERYLRIDTICQRTAQICTQDNLMSDAYYEQMMYVGDSRVHALLNLHLSGDPIWLRNAIEVFDWSRMPDGNIQSCYPNKSNFVHPTYSLVWVDMLHDYMMYVDDKAFLSSYKQSIRSTLNWFETHLNPNGLVGDPFPASYFVDWYNDAPFAGDGSYPGMRKGNSAVVTLSYAATLRRAADLFSYMGDTDEAILYRQRASRVIADVIAACWDEKKGLFAETPDKAFFDERANIIAIAAHLYNNPAKEAEFLRHVLADKSISQSCYYFRLSHFEEMRRLGVGDQMDRVLDIWLDLLPLGMTTTPERIARQRSEAHPWSGAPTIAFTKVVAGIAPAEPGFKSVSIRPAMGHLKEVVATYPHALGEIKVDLRKDKKGKLRAIVTLPKGLSGTFEYEGRIVGLSEGEQTLKL